MVGQKLHRHAEGRLELGIGAAVAELGEIVRGAGGELPQAIIWAGHHGSESGAMAKRC